MIISEKNLMSKQTHTHKRLPENYLVILEIHNV